MGKIVVNKHFPDYKEITKEVFDAVHGQAEIVISNDIGFEGLYVLNEAGNVVRINSTSDVNLEQVRRIVIDYLDGNYITSAQTAEIINELSGSVITVYDNVSELSGTVRTLIESGLNIDENSIRNIAKEEASMAVAEVVASADTSFDTLKEIADWIQNDTTGAAAMANDIASLNTEVDDIQTNLPVLIQKYLEEAIRNINAAEHIALTRAQYDWLIEHGSVDIKENGVNKTVVYSDYAYYAIYEDEEVIKYSLTFKNGDEIISTEEIEPGTIIEYPIMDSYIDGNLTYNFVWVDNSYSGAQMPMYNVIITGKYTSELSLDEDYSPEKPLILGSATDNFVKLNNHKITAPIFTESNGEVIEGTTDSYAFWVKDGASLTIDGNGEVVAQEATYSMAVWANGGKVIINGGTYRNGGDSCDLIYASNGGKVYIYDGEFIANGPASGNAPGTKNSYSALNIKDKDRDICEIVVYGGRFHNFDPANNYSEGNGTNFVAEGYKSVEVEPNIWEVMPN